MEVLDRWESSTRSSNNSLAFNRSISSSTRCTSNEHRNYGHDSEGRTEDLLAMHPSRRPS
eukprot:3836423-Lingulodinium_polyedra.AAC.1